jgi:glycosyltransferase involved in cell wall biosynthesis
MDKIHIGWLSDFGVIGSGYSSLSVPMCQGLAELGYDVKAAALEYKGEQHSYDFSLIPCTNFPEAEGTIRNLHKTWNIDVLIVALDIPAQIPFMRKIADMQLNYVGIFPVEADPLSFTWAMELMNMKKRFVISQFGADECNKANVPAEHIQIGVDVESWKKPTEEERELLRGSFGFDGDTFVILTVADNQERKNLVRSMEIVSDFVKENPDANVQYLMVTREHLRVGWALMDYAQVLGIAPNLRIFERGLDFKKLWSMYAVSDVFLLTSKAEGLGLPLLEAMSVGVPCLATECTAIAELLADGRGTLIEPLDDFDLRYIDPFGNANRYFAKRSHGLDQLQQIYENRPDTIKAREYVESRKWDIPVDQLDKAILEIVS